MKKLLVSVAALCLVGGVFVGDALSEGANGDVEIINIKISPNTLVMRSPGTWVTVHADIPYSVVVGATVELNGIPAGLTKADDCGNLVAKFTQTEVKAIVAAPSATLTLTGTTVNGVDFAGTDTISVK